jgi:hypothetical protein
LADGKPQGTQLVEYVETGGLRWGQTSWMAANATWPFANMWVSSDRLRLTVDVWGIWKKSFEFERVEVSQIRGKPGLFSVGVIVEHEKAGYPPFILFWTFRYKTLCAELRSRGYRVTET